MNEAQNYVILVDENDQVIGHEEKHLAHEKALCHRAFSIFIFRKTNAGLETLLQKRHPEKYHCPNLWTNACCSHPRPDEHTEAAAKRRLQQELGVAMALNYGEKFHYIAKFDNGLTENEIDHVFWVDYDAQNFQPNPIEIADIKWVNVDSLQQDLVKNPNIYTPWLKPALAIALKREQNRCEY